MRLTQKLLSFIHRVFDKDPLPFLALRVQYDGGLAWQVSDGILTTIVTGGSGQNLSISLAQYTVGEIADFIAMQPGYSIPYVDRSELSLLSSRVLIDSSGDISLSNGDHLYGYQSQLWSYIEAQASELEQAEVQIGEMLKQMSTPTASDIWLDELGGYYGVPRLQGELDAGYGPRIIAEVLRPRSNNVALELAISAYTGQTTTVSDVVKYGDVFPLYNGAIVRDATHFYNATNAPSYGLFDVQYAYDLLNGSDPTAFAQTVIGLIGRYRAAGTQLRNLILESGSGIADTLTAPTDGFGAIVAASAFSDALNSPTDSISIAATVGAFADALTAPADAESITIGYAYKYNGLRSYNSQIYRVGGQSITESL